MNIAQASTPTSFYALAAAIFSLIPARKAKMIILVLQQLSDSAFSALQHCYGDGSCGKCHCLCCIFTCWSYRTDICVHELG